jgi:hypothetical protein
MFRRYLFFLTFIFFSISMLFGQGSQKIRPAKIKPQISWKDSLYFGGNLGIQFTGNGSLIDLSPNVGYKFNKYLSVGLQGIFTNITVRDINFLWLRKFY